MQPVSGWQGIRDAGTAGQYLITGTSDANGLLYEGPISGVGGTSYAVNYPGRHDHERLRPRHPRRRRASGWSAATRTGDGTVHGFLFQGTTADLSNAGDYRTIDYPEREVHLRPQHDGRPRGRQRRRPRGERADRHGPRLPLQRRHGHAPARHRLSGLDDHHGLRHLVQRRHELHDRRRLYRRSASRARRSATATWSTTTRRPGSSPTGRRSTTRTGWSARTSSPTSRASAAPRRASTRSAPTRSRAGSSQPRPGLAR